MGEDASLDDFLGGESSEQSEAEPAEETADETGPSDTGESTATVEPETGTGDDAEPDAATDTDDVEPAGTTYAWSDEGTTCESCGETVERRWRQDDRLVCPGCKDWAQG